MTPHIHIEDARAAIDAVNNELTTWINRARNAEEERNQLLNDNTLLKTEFTDIAANAQWLADIIQSHLPHLPEAREALDASPGVSTARLKAELMAATARAMRGERERVWSKQGWDSAIVFLEYCAHRYLEKTEGGE